MNQITFIEDSKKRRSLVYGNAIDNNMNKRIVRTVGEKELEIVQTCTLEKVIGIINGVIDKNSLEINIEEG